ncbi:MAG: conserved hypothetical secreted protein [Myxococcaceae bacterium]|nr:conserved hypothetical secreted protein [Myxococcaceae bacterium]
MVPRERPQERSTLVHCALLAAAVLATSCASAPAARPPPKPTAEPAAPAAPSAPASATERRARYVRELLTVIGRAAPEQIGYLGLPGFDGAVIDLSLASDERDVRDLAAIAVRFAEERRTEPDADARIDLVILEDAAHRFSTRTELSNRVRVRLPDVAKIFYQGLAPLFGERATPEQRAAGAARVRRYLGEGSPPLVDAAIARVRDDIAHKKLLPTKTEVRTDLEGVPALRGAIVPLVEKNAATQATAIGAAIDRWHAFVESEVLPAARDDYRLPPEIYAMNLRDAGIDEDPAAVATRAHVAYDRTMSEWRALAKEVAVERHLAGTSPVEVLAALKRERRTGAALQTLFEQRIVDVEQVIRREHIVTLPARPLTFRAATPAETALNPSPTIDIQGFVNGAKDIAVIMPGAPAAGAAPYDDFTFDAATWPLLVHEGRPGHEMQFTTAIAHGMSTARTLFAFNPANIEGWALYCEGLMRPFMPRESRFVALQYLLIREARAFLDPGLQSGSVTPSDVKHVLHDELGASAALTDSEVKRYTFQSPGQAVAYFFGLEKLQRLRTEAEAVLGPRFDLARFNDAILNQGFAPLSLVADGVRSELGMPAPAR